MHGLPIQSVARSKIVAVDPGPFVGHATMHSVPIGPKRLNRAHGSTKENKQKILLCVCMFSVHVKIGLTWPQMGPEGFFPTNPDLAGILGRTCLFDFENSYVCFTFC